MMLKILSVFLVLLTLPLGTRTHSEELPPMVSIFSVKQEKVVKVTPLTSTMNQSILDALQSSPTPYGGFSVDPKAGLIVHVPYSSPIAVTNPIYSDVIKEVYLFLEPGQSLRALLFYSSSHKNAVVDLKYDMERFIRSNDLGELWSDRSVTNGRP
ncbi:hypothetical protein [Cohnella lupini]|uniref:Uncharacterized protein n=1 Tax=Cohnella lupini TaxID=1294267 RepID=A0A3D9IBL9_9BACL|nr:hypothetical protein [Cohnella lupini]RED59183.1 hypothetical protein DFP95_10721 [Cohnella lupini]